MVEDVVLPAGVQFRHDVVEQRDGLLAGQRTNDEAFGHFEAQRAGPLLALGAERLDRQAVELDDQVIAVRTHRRKARKRVFTAMCLQKHRKLLLYYCRIRRRELE